MSNYFVNLPAARVPENAMLNFEPVNNAFEAVRRQNNSNREFDQQQSQLDAQNADMAYNRQRAVKSDQMAEIKRMGEAAAAYDRLSDPAQRAAGLQRILAQHPNADGLGPEYRDPNTAFKLIAAEAGQWRDPREDEATNLELQYKRAQIKALDEKQNDPIQQLLVDRLRGRGGQPAQAPQSPMLQPQSYQGGPQTPGLQLVGDQVEAPAPPAAESGQPGMVETPFGPMSEQEARDLAGPMLLNPKYAAAGKAILDSIDKGGAGALAKPTVNQLEERTMNAATQLGRLNTIGKQFKDVYQTVPKRFEMLLASWAAKAGGPAALSREQQSELGNYAKFRASAVNNLNTILKELSGAAVTPQEYERIKSEQPTAGTGIFDGDDPVTFKAKTENSVALQRSAIARYNFMRSQGLSFTKDTIDQFMSLDDVPVAIDRRGTEIEQQLRQTNPKIDPMQLDQAVRGQLKREFGI